jgi:MYXO-CTERM domain-containing protein
MHFYLGSPPPVLSAPDLLAAANQAAAVWSYPQVAATDIRLGVVAEPEAAAEVGHDGRNVIVFRQDTWCRQPPPLDDAGNPEPGCYSANALAVTSIFKNKNSGEIVDADIEFNAVFYSWGDLVGQPALATTSTADFQNALTHELGHVIGLDHNCYTASDGQPRRSDNTGALAMDCYGSVPPPVAVLEATMYPSVSLGDTTRRDLSPDDELGVSEIYPHRHEVCPSPEGGCRVAPATPGPRSWPKTVALTGMALLASLALWRRRRRQSRGVKEMPGA